MSTSPNRDNAPTSPNHDTCDCPIVTETVFVPPHLRGTDEGSHKRETGKLHRLGCPVGKALYEGDNT